LGIGALQSTVRAAIGLLSPSARSGEFYGFWALVGRLAAACGPLVFGLVSSGTGSQRLAVLAVAGFFLAALLGLAGFDEERGRRAAAES